MSGEPEDWRWSSYATALGLTADFAFVDATLVLAELGGSLDALRALVVQARPHTCPKQDRVWVADTETGVPETFSAAPSAPARGAGAS